SAASSSPRGFGRGRRSSGRFFAWVIGGSLDSALAADWLTSTWDQNAALFSCSPAAAVVEEVAGEWLKELFDLPRDASFAFTNGCQMAHFTCLAAARRSVLRQVGHDVKEHGLFSAPAISVICGEERHGSVDSALQHLGFGDKQIHGIDTHSPGKLDVAEFTRLLEEHAGPKIVALGAGDINTGAFDDFRTLIPIAKRHNAWVHIDGAFGLMARACAEMRSCLDGVELADSWATDAHKWLNVPYDNGIAIIRNSEDHRASMTIGASYIAPKHGVRDQIDWNPEWSRRARGFSVYAAILELGRDGLDALVENCCRMATALIDGLGELPNVEVLWRPTLNQGLFRVVDPSSTATDDDHVQRTEEVMLRINQSGEAFFSGTTWRGKRAIRVSVVNWRTNRTEVERTIGAVANTIRELES
ncbi:MAG: aminotransferase class V-fold PLP-dependent enzyme, partial [Planctomycetota bacterium]